MNNNEADDSNLNSDHFLTDVNPIDNSELQILQVLIRMILLLMMTL